MRIGTYYYEWKQHVRFKLSYRVLCIIRFGKIKGSLKQFYLEFENMFLLYLRYLFHFSNSSRSGSFSRRVDIPSLKRGRCKMGLRQRPHGPLPRFLPVGGFTPTQKTQVVGIPHTVFCC